MPANGSSEGEIEMYCMTETTAPVVTLRPRANDNRPQPATARLDTLYEPMAVFSIDAQNRGDHTPKGIARAAELFAQWCADRGVGVKALGGCYEGQEEPAWIMRLADFHSRRVREVWCFHQLSVLILSGAHGDGRRRASLWFPNGDTTVELGVWKCVGNSRPSVDAWTYDPDSGGYWVADMPTDLLRRAGRAVPDREKYLLAVVDMYADEAAVGGAKSRAPVYVPTDPYGERFRNEDEAS
jgi:hypothetical protein